MKNKYKISNFFDSYASGEAMPKHENWLDTHVLPFLKSNITTVLDFGCANGRNFYPFKNYNCVGFDLYQTNQIKKFCDFDYHVSSVEDFVNNIDLYQIDWQNALVMSHGCLMYCKNSEDQNKFITKLRDKGCKNLVLHEYVSDKVIKAGNMSDFARNGGLGYLDLNTQNLSLFSPPAGNKINFRCLQNDLYALIHLQK